MTGRPRGHAIEVRLYAEDPAAGWQPQSGTADPLRPRRRRGRVRRPRPYGVRVDSGFVDGDEVSTHYDPMLAKVIAWAPTRAEALRRLAGALARAQVHGLITNRDLLVRCCATPSSSPAT